MAEPGTVRVYYPYTDTYKTVKLNGTGAACGGKPHNASCIMYSWYYRPHADGCRLLLTYTAPLFHAAWSSVSDIRAMTLSRYGTRLLVLLDKQLLVYQVGTRPLWNVAPVYDMVRTRHIIVGKQGLGHWTRCVCVTGAPGRPGPWLLL